MRAPDSAPASDETAVRDAHASLDDVARARLAALERRSLRRRLVTTDRTDAVRAGRDGVELVSFSCNDYLGLSHHPDVVAASIEATRRYGAGAGSARLVNGNHPLYAELERKLAALKGTADAIVFGSGYLASVGTIPALAGAADLIVLDELSHSCLLAGAELARSRVLPFRHNDAAHAAELLAAHRSEHRHCLLVTEGVFSMEGDLAPLSALAALAARHDAWLMTDDAHGLGVVGDGRGSTFAAGLDAATVPLQMGTLSKAAGSYGGYLCASETVVELLRNRARSFVYSTGLPPGAVAGASRALGLIAADRELVRRPLARALVFTAELSLPPATSPIVAVTLGGAERALHASERLRDAGFLVAAIRPPTVPPGTSRLRFTFSAEHTEEQVHALAVAVAPLLRAC
ncbi:MAG TPA: aminotransferase class I/II-fold pyridoxal phosphate-dependent enzyme [Gammaproteobacteria bacterium]|nr:aminotransferase class I/II-fold pyridoxal phosphate-dependent enzyme [Gammaproteobacteria bacterium]